MSKKLLNTAIIFDIPLFGKSKSDLLKIVQNRLKMTTKTSLLWINTPNAEQVVQAMDDDIFRSCLRESTINIPDGVSLVLATRLNSVEGQVKERISGVDMVEAICGEASRSKQKVFLLGGKAGASGKAAAVLSSRYLGLSVKSDTGAKNIQTETKEELERILGIIQKFKTDVLFVGYGAPHQEKWVRRNREVLGKMGVKFVMVVGGAFDMISGNIRRAPLFMRRIGLEWLWRLVQEPWRWKRQLRLVRFWGKMLEEWVG